MKGVVEEGEAGMADRAGDIISYKDTSRNLSDKKSSGDKRTSRIYISEEEQSVEKHSKCKGPGAELYLVSSKNSERAHVATVG